MVPSTQPSRALLIAAGTLTQVIGAMCLILALASLPVAHDLKTGMTGVLASIVAALAAIVCGTLVWRGRLVPLALAAGLDIGFGVGLPRGGSAVGAILRMLPADDFSTAETLITIAAVLMFVAAIVCVIAVPSALALRRWARDELAREAGSTDPGLDVGVAEVVSVRHAELADDAPTKERPALPKARDTLRGIGTQRLTATQIIRPAGAPQRHRVLIIAGVALTVIAIGIIVISAGTGSRPSSGSGSGSAGVAGSAGSARSAVGGSTGSANTSPGLDAAVMAIDAPPEPPPFSDFIAHLHGELAAPTNLDALFAPGVFAFGADAHDVAEGRDAVVAQLREDLGAGGRVTVKVAQSGSEGNVGWLAEELRVGDTTFVISAVAGLTDQAWTIAALHWAVPMPNETAYRLARAGELAVPDAIPDAHDASLLAQAMKTAFASKALFVEARSSRADAFNVGSAGERLKGGDTIKKVFSRIHANIHRHDAVKVGSIGDTAGWGAANVDFRDADRDGTEVTQTFRVLAVWIKEDAGWRIVQTQWSNPR